MFILRNNLPSLEKNETLENGPELYVLAQFSTNPDFWFILLTWRRE